VASVDDDELVGRAENARILLVHLHEALRDRLFELRDPARFSDIIRRCGIYPSLGTLKHMIPSVLASVNSFVSDRAKKDLIEYSHSFDGPKLMVDEISTHVNRMGGAQKDKSWMYMRWMVRPTPDLGILSHFSPRDLIVPVTPNIAGVAVSLGLIDKFASSLWENEEEIESVRDKVTGFAKTISPNDPTRVDYPLFILGRWLRGKDLTTKTLIGALELFDRLHKATGYARIEYVMLGRYESGWEKMVAETLSRLRISFQLKPLRFPLPKDVTYTPDFILPNTTCQGKTVVLEPHAVMNEFDNRKFSLFVEMFGREYHLIVIMRNNDIDYYRSLKLLPMETGYEIWPFEYIDIHLDRLIKKQR